MILQRHTLGDRLDITNARFAATANPVRTRLAIVAAALLAMGMVADDLATTLRGSSPQSVVYDNGQGKGLSADEKDAGRLWARANGPTSLSGCPTYPKPFLDGCAAQVAETGARL